MTHRPQPDPKTLEDVHHLLRTTDFATIDELASNVELGDVQQMESQAAPPERQTSLAAGSPPLPKRR